MPGHLMTQQPRGSPRSLGNAWGWGQTDPQGGRAPPSIDSVTHKTGEAVSRGHKVTERYSCKSAGPGLQATQHLAREGALTPVPSSGPETGHRRKLQAGHIWGKQDRCWMNRSLKAASETTSLPASHPARPGFQWEMDFVK